VQCWGVPRLIAAFEADSKEGSGADAVYYVITQRSAGVGLRQLVADGLRPTEEQVISVGVGLLRALEGLNQLRPPITHGAIALVQGI